jgi:Holliday junction resolvase-like predicted endonuclease
VTDRERDRLVRRLLHYLERNDVESFGRALGEYTSADILTALRAQKALTRGSPETRDGAARLLVAEARIVFDPAEADEYARYAQFSIRISVLREAVRREIERQKKQMPKLSIRQLNVLAERKFKKILHRQPGLSPEHLASLATHQMETELHEHVGGATDANFAVLRAISEVSTIAGPRDLKRPDVFAKAAGPFERIITLSSFLVSIDYMFDSASFGDFHVSSVDPDAKIFTLDYADIRLELIKQMALRRTMFQVISGRRHPRFVRERLKASQDAVLFPAIERQILRSGARMPDARQLRQLEDHSEAMLMQVDAEDDLILVAAKSDVRAVMLYHMSMALRWASMACHMVTKNLSGQARRAFVDDICFEDLIEGFEGPEQRDAAHSAWDDLTTDLPVKNHFDLCRRPFLRTSPTSVQAIRQAEGGVWTTVVREILNKGGETGRNYGAVFEEFYAKSFVETGWDIVGRNIKLSGGAGQLTEVDLLLKRQDLLLVVEIKALTGSGVSPYDHWKNRNIIEKGCRQALCAADYLRANRKVLVSIASRKVADQIAVIQPLVLTNQATFDGWAHLDVPVAGETIRKAITTGSRVEYYDAETLEVQRVDHYLRVEELSTATILQALRDPIELKIAPEQGAVEHVVMTIADCPFHVPNTVAGSA